MRYNLFVSWELFSAPSCASFQSRLDSLGEAVQLQRTFAFVSSRLPFDEAYALLAEKVSGDERVAVIEAAGGASFTSPISVRNAMDKLWLEGEPTRGLRPQC